MSYSVAKSFVEQYGGGLVDKMRNGQFSPGDHVVVLIFNGTIGAIVKCEDMSRIPIPLGVMVYGNHSRPMNVVVWLLQKKGQPAA